MHVRIQAALHHINKDMTSCFLHCSSSDLPNFFASTKFFACLDLLESKELFEATEMVRLPPISSGPTSIHQ